MLWGKECSVHMGACFSGGSLDAPVQAAQARSQSLNISFKFHPPSSRVQTYPILQIKDPITYTLKESSFCRSWQNQTLADMLGILEAAL